MAATGADPCPDGSEQARQKRAAAPFVVAAARRVGVSTERQARRWRDACEGERCRWLVAPAAREFVARIGRLAFGDGWRRWTTPPRTLDPRCRSRPMLIAAIISRNSGAGS